MFEHSIKVPRLYKTAAKIVKRVKKEGTSVKQLVYEKKHPNLKALYALVVETLRNEENLKTILKKSQLLENETRLDQFLARVLITELLWGKKKLPGESKPIKTILSYQEKFLDNYTDKKAKVRKQKINKPKYVRVNTLKISVEEVINLFRDEGWSLIRCGDGSDYSAFLATLASLSEDQFMIDTLIKDLLIFPPKTEFYKHKLIKNGSILLQDKASCISPFLLAPPEGATVLDMCAAPGMKTMQVASMVGQNGRVYAIERDPRRYDILKSLLEGTNSKNVTAINNDALKLTDFDVPDVEYILVDPSCSGSGIIDRIDFEDPQTDGPRLQKLFCFQIKMLRHALENFKNAKRVVYSTCSIYPQENEDIVKEAIEQTQNFKIVPLNEFLKNKWYNFGSKEYQIGPYCLYAKPEIDKTNGFFIAVFERLGDDETNPFYVERKTFQNRHNLKSNTEEITIKTEKIDPCYENHGETNEIFCIASSKQNKQKLKIKMEPNEEKESFSIEFEAEKQMEKDSNVKNEVTVEFSPKKHKKKCKKSKKEHVDIPEESTSTELVTKSKKKRKTSTVQDGSARASREENSVQIVEENIDYDPKIKKKRKKHLENYANAELDLNNQNCEIERKTKKKKKHKIEREDKHEQISGLEENGRPSDKDDFKSGVDDLILKSKKKRKKDSQSLNVEPIEKPCKTVEENDDKKTKKKKINIMDTTSEQQTSENLLVENELSTKTKKKKKSKKVEQSIDLDESLTSSVKQKKCKKSRKNKENIVETYDSSEKEFKKKKLNR